jgi:N-methylhydantoinase A/oxoprolinase/acetone carboxylase beta subunit
MRLGIDVGGTHTDAVLIRDKEIVSKAKVPTDHGRLISSIRTALREILKDVEPGQVSSLNLSTTLCTNAIVENRLEPVGMIVSGGPGIAPEMHRIGTHFAVLSGSVDHRGSEINPLDQAELERTIEGFARDGVRVFGAVTKFSPRNPSQELLIRDRTAERSDFVTMGHLLSGNLNFPRRIATAYFNSAVWRMYNQFLDAIGESLNEFGLRCVVNAVKADGGTMPLPLSRTLPVQSIFSGPSASIMGIMALCPVDQDTIVLDIGGTTTDIAVFASGVPLLEPQGIAIDGRPTLVRALKARSIGIGGDSALRVVSGTPRVGPDRAGPPMAAGGRHPTLTDALNVMGYSAFRNTEASRFGLLELAHELGVDTREAAQRFVRAASGRICQETGSFLAEINEKPVYTLHELLEGRKIEPRRLIVMGGPAEAMSVPLEECLRLKVSFPPHFEVANAVGAAMTRTTMAVDLHADTPKGRLYIPSLGIVRPIARSYTLEDGIRDARSVLLGRLEELAIPMSAEDIQITQASSFNMVEGFSTLGRNIRVKCQTLPGVERHLYDRG